MPYNSKFEYTKFILPLLFLSACSIFKEPISPQHYTDVPVFSFPTNSIWYQKIATNAEVDPKSTLFVENFVATKPAYSPWGLASIPVFNTDDETPRYQVPVYAFPSPLTGLRSVPIPDHATPYRESDSPIALIDTSQSSIFEFWQFHILAGRWTAGNGGKFELNSDGIAPAMITRASGFSLLCGLIWPQEILGKEIKHAMVLSMVQTRNGNPVSPATASDGWNDSEGAIPMGAHIQLDPNLDLATIPNIDEYQRAVYLALQIYGAYVADTGGFSLFFVSPNSYSEDPYKKIPSYNSDFQTFDFSNLPVEKLRVIKLGAEVTEKNRVYAPAKDYY